MLKSRRSEVKIFEILHNLWLNLIQGNQYLVQSNYCEHSCWQTSKEVETKQKDKFFYYWWSKLNFPPQNLRIQIEHKYLSEADTRLIPGNPRLWRVYM